jgi:hypothetical protein
MDYGLQLDCFDDPFTVLPPQMFETTHIPHDAIVPSTQDSQSSYLCLTGLLAVSCEHSYSGMASMIPGQPSLLSDTLQYGTSHNAESSQLYQSPGEITRKKRKGIMSQINSHRERRSSFGTNKLAAHIINRGETTRRIQGCQAKA